MLKGCTVQKLKIFPARKRVHPDFETHPASSFDRYRGMSHTGYSSRDEKLSNNPD